MSYHFEEKVPGHSGDESFVLQIGKQRGCWIVRLIDIEDRATGINTEILFGVFGPGGFSTDVLLPIETT